MNFDVKIEADLVVCVIATSRRDAARRAASAGRAAMAEGCAIIAPGTDRAEGVLAWPSTAADVEIRAIAETEPDVFEVAIPTSLALEVFASTVSAARAQAGARAIAILDAYPGVAYQSDGVLGMALTHAGDLSDSDAWLVEPAPGPACPGIRGVEVRRSAA